jgi:hypothetical protein
VWHTSIEPCRSDVALLVAGRVNKNYLERSLLSMMTTSERQVINDAIYGRNLDTARILEILAEHGVQTFPYPDNIKAIESSWFENHIMR